MNLFDLPEEVKAKLDVLNLEQLKGFQFIVQIDGEDFKGKETVAGFRSIGDMRTKLELVKIKELGYKGVYTFPKKEIDTSITLERPLTFSRSLWNWYMSWRYWTKGLPDYRKSMSIYLLDTINEPGLGNIVYEAWRWDFYNCYISAWNAPALSSTVSKIAIESITIEHSGIVEAKGVLSGQAGEILSLFT